MLTRREVLGMLGASATLKAEVSERARQLHRDALVFDGHVHMINRQFYHGGDIRDLPLITDAMLRRGYSEERIRKFLGGNLLRVFRQVTEG